MTIMSYKRIETLLDAKSAGLFLQVRCTQCGRKAIFDPDGFLLYDKVRLNTSLRRLAAVLRCRGEVGRNDGCGRRGVELMAIMWPPFELSPPPPRPVAHPTPQGIDPEAWAKAGDSERKRLVRAARG
jgi:hypothetical protein